MTTREEIERLEKELDWITGLISQQDRTEQEIDYLRFYWQDAWLALDTMTELASYDL